MTNTRMDRLLWTFLISILCIGLSFGIYFARTHRHEEGASQRCKWIGNGDLLYRSSYSMLVCEGDDGRISSTISDTGSGWETQYPYREKFTTLEAAQRFVERKLNVIQAEKSNERNCHGEDNSDRDDAHGSSKGRCGN